MGGGSAVPEALIRAFDERFGVPIVQGWGMTETSPLASIVAAARDAAGCAEDEALRAARAAGPHRAARRVPHRRGGGRRAAGPRPVRSRATTTTTTPSREKFTDDGWLRTGDVAELRRRRATSSLVDRTKDLVKSGGEWISLGRARERDHGPPRRARGRGDRHPRRALGRAAVRVRGARATGSELDGDGLREFLADRVAKWWLPDRVEFIDEVPEDLGGQVRQEGAARPAGAGRRRGLRPRRPVATSPRRRRPAAGTAPCASRSAARRPWRPASRRRPAGPARRRRRSA